MKNIEGTRQITLITSGKERSFTFKRLQKIKGGDCLIKTHDSAKL